MTTEHVSVPRELDNLTDQDLAEFVAIGLRHAEVKNFQLDDLRPAFKKLKAILSRATPSEERITATNWPKPSAPRVVTDEDLLLLSKANHELGQYGFLNDSARNTRRFDRFINGQKIVSALYAKLRFGSTDDVTALEALPHAAVPDAEVCLWDTQWMNIVNHDNCYRDWSKDDAIAHAVKMTEQAIARNIADGKLPPKKIDAAPQAGERG